MKVFINCGSQPIHFIRLWNYAKILSENERYEVFFQGYDYKLNRSPNYSLNGSQFLEKEFYLKKLSQSDVVICHGGSGAIFDSIRSGHKPFVLPRLSSFKEHNDDHQVELFNKCVEHDIILKLDLSNFLPHSTIDPDNFINGKLLFNGHLKTALLSLLMKYKKKTT